MASGFLGSGECDDPLRPSHLKRAFFSWDRVSPDAVTLASKSFCIPREC
jgi:hypothetical protein